MFTSRDPLRLQSQEREALQAVIRSTRSPAGWVRRAQVLLLLAEGHSVRRVEAQTGMSLRRVVYWKQRWQQEGLDGLLDAARPGRPKKLTAEKEAMILAATQSSPVKPITHWSSRRLARRVGVSHVTVMRVWHKAGLQPHRLRRYKASPDPDFEAKAKDILGLYLNPPEKAVVFCVDEKTAIQALDRTQPALPLRSGKPERHSVEYVRHGTVCLLAALEVHTGKVQSRCVARHTSEEFVRFLDEAVVGQRRKQIYLILDNLSAHKTAAVRAWRERHPHVQFHFTPTYSSWLNQVEIWFGLITRDCIRRGIFRSVLDLVSKILSYVRLYNRNAQPFRWTYRNPRKRIHVSPISVTRH
jgi:transposase